jgi:YrbI family 3-deoxy-D-manno-octulosonate 8-phosphate phosphatase
MLCLDFDGVLTSNDVWISEASGIRGAEMVRCWRGDGIGLRQLQENGTDVYVISGECNPVVGYRCTKLGVSWAQNEKARGDFCKLPILEARLKLRGWSLAEVAYIGNDVNDADCLRSVGLPIVVADAHPDVLPLARYITSARGGYGAVREVCDLIVKVKRGKPV